MPPLKSSLIKPSKSMLFFHIWNANFSVTLINSQMYMTKPKQVQKKLSENTGKTFSVIMPPFTSRGGGHNYGNDCTRRTFSKKGSLGWVLSQHCKIMFLVVLSRCIVHRVSVCGDVVGWWVGSGGGWTGGRNGGRAGREGERLEAEAAPGSSSRCCLRPGVGLPSGCWPSPPPPTNPPIHPQALTNTKSSLIIHNHLVTTQC